MIGLLCFVLAVLASPFKSKSRLEAENAVLRLQLNVLRRSLHGRVRLTNHDRWFLSSCIAGFHQSCRFSQSSSPDARALASGRFSLLLALEVAPIGRATADRHGAARVGPADERRKSALGRATHSRRTAQARVEVAQSSVAKYRSNDGAAQPGMANLPAQPRAGHCRHGLTPIECDATGRKSPQQDRSHKRWREANGGAQCGKSACCV
jgi:hypothetical protein